DVAGGRVVKGIRFQGLRDVGDPVELGGRYSDEGADELVFLDVRATLDERRTLVELVAKIAERLSIPFTVGGGVRSARDAEELLAAGADKVAVNSAHVADALEVAQAALLASILHEDPERLGTLRAELRERGVQLR